jgi:glycosyltransferase involved in cell wall biosynthesis
MKPEISVVVPMRNEAASVPELYSELTAALEGFGRSYEIVAIDSCRPATEGSACQGHPVPA